MKPAMYSVDDGETWLPIHNNVRVFYDVACDEEDDLELYAILSAEGIILDVYSHEGSDNEGSYGMDLDELVKLTCSY